MAKSKSKFQNSMELRLTAAVVVLSILKCFLLLSSTSSLQGLHLLLLFSQWLISGIHKTKLGNAPLWLFILWLIKTWPFIKLHMDEFSCRFGVRSVSHCPAVSRKSVSTSLPTPQSVVDVANKNSRMAWFKPWYYTSRSIFWVHTATVGTSL